MNEFHIDTIWLNITDSINITQRRKNILTSTKKYLFNEVMGTWVEPI